MRAQAVAVDHAISGTALQTIQPTMTDEVLRLTSEGEGQRVEFKESLSLEDKAIETLCAFLNSDGGRVLFGVRNDGAIVGVDIGANTLENLSGKISRLVEPRAAPSIETVHVNGKTVITVAVERRKAGQVFFVKGKAFARTGRTNSYLSVQVITARLTEEHEKKIEKAVEDALERREFDLASEMRRRGLVI